MLDNRIRGATVYDGNGGEPYTADIGIKDGIIAALGGDVGRAREEIDASGAIVTPGFVDIHTHFDGQVSWDETLVPSVLHGVTSCVMGNCGVGFAPLRENEQERLISLMEGVEDIPGSVLAEGIDFRWESFPEYMDAIDDIPHSIDFAVQVPHDALRLYVMGDRAENLEPASESDNVAMQAIVRDALQAGAAGFSTGRTDIHRTAKGQWTPSSEATQEELCGISAQFAGFDHGVIQVVSDFDLLRDSGRFDEEFDLIDAMAAASGDRPLSMTWLQRVPGEDQWRDIEKRVASAAQRGLDIKLQAAARGIGVITGLDTSFHPFTGVPAYKEISSLPLAERVQRMRDPKVRERMLTEKSEPLAGDGSPVPPFVDQILAQIDQLSARMFPMQGEVDYEPPVEASFLARARVAGCRPLEAIYDYLVDGDGNSLIYFPVFNYAGGNLDVVYEMLNHPQVLASLSDAGAHVGTICDASFPTTMLAHWCRDRDGSRLPLPRVVQMLSANNADHMGFSDRGRIGVGQRADINVIDFDKLGLRPPEIRHDLPGGGRRLVQEARGYVATLVKGEVVCANGNVSEARPGRLIRQPRRNAQC
ncbi:MAG: amidohydrolase family protein [Gammaproteobacteria bacterium]|nr:amidohydrolase family protein [Gammaproteobacteria bacterium]